MKFLRKTLFAVAVGAALFATGCEEDGSPGSESQDIRQGPSDPTMQKVPEAPGEFAISRHKDDGQWYFDLVGAKGKILLASEGYQERPSAINGILSIEENGVHLEKYELAATPEGDWRFVLRAGNNQVIGDSTVYRTEEAAQAGIEATRDLVAGIVQFKAAVTNGARFDLWRDEDDREWYFVLRAADGRTLLESEGYTGRTGAVNGIESVRENGKNPARYQILDGEGEVYFILKAGNGQEIGASPGFATVGEAEAGMAETQALITSERVASPW